MSTIETVLENGHATLEEFNILEKDIGFTRFWSEGQDESFWGIKLTEDKFVLANHPIDFWGAPDTVGLVGVYAETNSKNVMQYKPSVELFIKTDRPVTEVKAEIILGE